MHTHRSPARAPGLWRAIVPFLLFTTPAVLLGLFVVPRAGGREAAADAPFTRRGKSPQAVFADTTERISALLARLKIAVAEDADTRPLIAELREAQNELRKADAGIRDRFRCTRLHCEEHALPVATLERLETACRNHAATARLVDDSVQAVLTAAQPSAVRGGDLATAVKASHATLADLELRDPPGTYNSEPVLWQPGAPGDVTAGGCTGDVEHRAVSARRATPGVPRGDRDLRTTREMEISAPIVDKAAALGNSPVAIYNFVVNEFWFDPYYGARKRAEQTLKERSGNDYDLVSLLIALLRAAGYEARYASGVVRVPADLAANWLRVDTPCLAGWILQVKGLEGDCMCLVPGVNAVQCRRVWVEAYVSRGRGGPRTWVPLDPAFKLHDVTPGIDTPEEMDLDAQAFLDDYCEPADPAVALPRLETPVELFKQQITDYLTDHHPAETVESVKRRAEIIAVDYGLLPASLPYKVMTRDMELAAIPDDVVYRLRLHLHAGDTTLLDETLSLPDVLGRRLVLDYVGSTPEDQTTIDSYDSIYDVPPYLVDLTPVVCVDGEVVATGVGSVGMGRKHDSDLHFLAPANDANYPPNVIPAIYNDMTAGAAVAVGLLAGAVAEPALDPVRRGSGDPSSLLHATAMDYLARCNRADRELAALMHCGLGWDIDNAIVENVVHVTKDATGTPQSFEWVSMRVDADRSVSWMWPTDQQDSSAEMKRFMILSGCAGSLEENRVFEESYGQDAVSTMKILQLATDQGITIYRRWDHLPLPENSLSSSNQRSLESAIENGRVVTFPASRIVAGDPTTGTWTGAGWISMKPSSGAASWTISGYSSGGETVDDWPSEFIDLMEGDEDVTSVDVIIVEPAADSPAAGAVFPADSNQQISFTYQLRVHYSGGTSTLLPKLFRNTTHFTTQEFGPGEYWFTARGPMGSAATRKISIVGVSIRKDDGSPAGAEPSPYIAARPGGHGTVPSEAFRAVVVPAGLAGTFQWSTTGGIVATSPGAQSTSVEATGSAPSAELGDERLNVTFTPSGGVPCHTDVAHRMTVFAVAIRTPGRGGDPADGFCVGKSIRYVAKVQPPAISGLSGKYSWTTNSPLLSLTGAASSSVTVKGGSAASAALGAEQLSVAFSPSRDATTAQATHSLTVAKVEIAGLTPNPYLLGYPVTADSMGSDVTVSYRILPDGYQAEAVKLTASGKDGVPVYAQTITPQPRGVQTVVWPVADDSLRRANRAKAPYKARIEITANATTDFDVADMKVHESHVLLTAEGNITECMEKREVTFTAIAGGFTSVAPLNPITFTFHYQHPDGTAWENSDWSYDLIQDDTVTAGNVPDGDLDHWFETPIYVQVEDGFTHTARSKDRTLRVWELWIKTFQGYASQKPWKVCIGDDIEFEALASPDCRDFEWDMPDGVPDAWNPTGGNGRSGVGMRIPFSDCARAHNSWFGERYGTVYVECVDGNGYKHRLFSTDKAKVFFPTRDDVAVDGTTPPTASNPPCWFVFWQQAGAGNDLVWFDDRLSPGQRGVCTPGFDPNLDVRGRRRIVDVLRPAVGVGANDPYDLGRFFISATGENAHNWLIVSGIDMFHIAVLHEMWHHRDFSDGVGKWDSDHDALHDDLETDTDVPPLGQWGPGEISPYNTHTHGLKDAEYRTLGMEIKVWQYSELNKYRGSDWSRGSYAWHH